MINVINRLYTVWLRLFSFLNIKENSRVDIRCDIPIKKNIFIEKNTTLYKNITIYKKENGLFKIGKYSHIAPYGYFLVGDKKIEIGNNVAIAPFCSFFAISNHHKKDNLITKSYLKGDIFIGNNILIGSHSTILPKTVIEDNVIVASNSVVKGRLEKGFLYGGTPAKKIKALYE